MKNFLTTTILVLLASTALAGGYDAPPIPAGAPAAVELPALPEVDWAKLGPYVDVFSPMVYHIYCHRPLEWISQVTAEVAARSGRAVWPIVQSCSEPTEMTVAEFEKALREGLKPPATGIMVYSTDCTLKENKWETMSRLYNAASR